MHNVQVTADMENASSEVAGKYGRIEEGRYLSVQLLNVNETTLLLKLMLIHATLIKKQQSIWGCVIRYGNLAFGHWIQAQTI